MVTPVGIALAELALDVFRTRSASYPDGIKVGELQRELVMAGHRIASDNPNVTLRTALNNSQAHGIWASLGNGLWGPGSGVSKMESGLTGRPLAEAMYAFAKGRYPSGVFHYEEVRLALEKSGVDVKGTGATTRRALERATDLFQHLPGRDGRWRLR